MSIDGRYVNFFKMKQSKEPAFLRNLKKKIGLFIIFIKAAKVIKRFTIK